MQETSKEDDVLEEKHYNSKKEYQSYGHEDEEELEDAKTKIIEKSPKERFYRFNEELGVGAYKTVYKGYDSESGCEVAWNVINLKKLPSVERKRISKEILMLKNLKHPNIIHFIGTWINKAKEEVVFITEIVTGGSLKSYLKKIKKPRLKIIKTWCKEILKGVQYLHSQKPHPIIHRDIKCDNIFINSNKGEIRIGDLGLATFLSHSITTSVLGTPEFMAPEIFDESYGIPCDIYAFGMSVLEMVTLQTPYKECANPAQIYKKLIEGKKPAALDLIKNDDVKSFILQCLKPQKERPTITQLLEDKFLDITDNDLDNLPVQLVTDAFSPDQPLKSLTKDQIIPSRKMRKKDAEIGTEEEETKNDHTNSTKHGVSGTIQAKTIADEINNRSVYNTSNIDTISAKQLDILPCESLEIKKEVLLQGKTKSEANSEKLNDFKQQTQTITSENHAEDKITMEVSKSTNIELNCTPSFKTKSEKMEKINVVDVKLLGVYLEAEFYRVLILILVTGKESWTIEKKIPNEEFTFSKIYDILTDLQHEYMIDMNDRHIRELTTEIIESPQKSKFIPDIKLEVTESDDIKKIKTEITTQENKQNIVEEDLLELENRHNSDILMETWREKFKSFYNSYLNDLAETIKDENHDSMMKRFWLETSLLKSLHDQQQNENNLKKSNPSPGSSDLPLIFSNGTEEKPARKIHYLNNIILAKSPDSSPYEGGFFSPPDASKKSANFLEIKEKESAFAKKSSNYQNSFKKPPLSPAKKYIEKDIKNHLALSLTLPDLTEPKIMSHKKSQSGVDFSNNLCFVEIPQIYSSKSTDLKKSANVKTNSITIQKISNESFGDPLSLRKDAPIAKNLLFENNKENSNSGKNKSKTNSEAIQSVGMMKKQIFYEQFNDVIFKGPLHSEMQHETHLQEMRLVKIGLQELLDLDSIDSSIYDENFEIIVKNFQAKYNLNVDGIFGNKCWAVMKNELLEKMKQRRREEDTKVKTEKEEKTKKIKDKQNKESAEAESKLLSNIQKELNK